MTASTAVVGGSYYFTVTIGSATSSVATLTITGVVYAAGYAFDSSGIQIAGYWENGTWNALTNSYGSYAVFANSLMVSGSDVYVAGDAYDSGSTVIAGYWKNGAWNALTNSYGSSYDASIQSLVVSP